MKQVNANEYLPIYKELGIDLDSLGCIMLNVDGKGIPLIPSKDYLYFTSDPKKFWIKGFVAGRKPHVTLLYGLLKEGNIYKKYIDQLLEDWSLPTILIHHVDYFDSPYKEEPYYCIVAHVDITPELLEGYHRLELLPHVNTFPEYKAHITIAYIKKDEQIRDEVINFYDKHLVGKEIKVLGLNYGGDKS